MPYRPPKKRPGFADLKGMLAQSKDTDSATYQTIQILIERLGQIQALNDANIADLRADIDAGRVTINGDDGPSVPFGPHAPTHQTGGNDIVTVTSLGGYTGNTANFLRADGTFQPPPTGGVPGLHAPTHQPGGADPMQVDAASNVGSLRTLGTGSNQAAAGNDPRFIPVPGMNLDYLGGYAAGTYNDGDIVVAADGVAYMCVVDGTTTPPEPWPGGGVKPHHVTHEPGGNDEIVNINAYHVTSGLVNQARLGSGAVGAGAKFLADNQTWQPIAFPPQVDMTPVGVIFAWPSNIPPANYLLCWGSEISRASYAVLFSIIGTTYGAGDGSTTFNVPNFIGRIPIGQTSSGALNFLGVVTGQLDHGHYLNIDANGSHQHSTDVHTHPAGSYITSAHNHGGVVGGETVAGGSHAHTFSATTGAESNIGAVDAGGSFYATRNPHTHTVSGTTDGGGNHSHHFEAGIPAEAVAVYGNSAAGGGGATSASGSHSHTGSTTANNPPVLTVNFIIKVL